MITYPFEEPKCCGNCEYYRYNFFHQFGDSFGGCIKHPDGELEPEAPACPDWKQIK
jgi:hypothetical protein